MRIRFLLSALAILFAVNSASGQKQINGVYNQSISCAPGYTTISAYTQDLRNDFRLLYILPDRNYPEYCCQLQPTSNGFISWASGLSWSGHYDYAIQERGKTGTGGVTWQTVATFTCDLP